MTGLAQPVEPWGVTTQRDHGRSCPGSPKKSLAGRGEPTTEMSADSSYSCPPFGLLSRTGGLSFTIIGVVVSRNYPDLESLPDYLRDLEARCKEATGTEVLWVCASTDSVAKELLTDPVQLPLLPYWKGETYDVRRIWRDSELVRLCDRVYVFQPATTKTTWNDWAKMPLVHPGVRLVTAGEKKARKRVKGKVLT